MTKLEDSLVAALKKPIADNDNERIVTLAASIGLKMAGRFSGEERTREKNVLYASEIGKPCLRQTWFRINEPKTAEPIPDKALFKFAYGDLIEDLAIFLLKHSGHKVTDEQRKVILELPNGWAVRGRIDCIVDGKVIDVKSASPMSFSAMKDGLNDDNDKFGYRHQTDFYHKTIYGDDGTGALLMIDKSSGYAKEVNVKAWESNYEMQKFLLDKTNKLAVDTPPPRGFQDRPSGARGNRELGVQCSYCEFKKTCWPGLRGFAYAKGPVWLTVVKDVPKVPEIKDAEE